MCWTAAGSGCTESKVPKISHQSHGVTTNNNLKINGLGVNGLAVNGIGLNGLGINGLGVNGLGINGLGINGLGVNGLGLNGLYVNGLGVNGLGLNGWDGDWGDDGLYLNGLGLNGLYVNGLGLNGLGVNGLGLNGYSVNGLYVNGLGLNGLGLNGLGLNGLYVNGLYVNGLGLNGLGLDGVCVSVSNQIVAGDIDGNGAVLDGDQEAALDLILGYLVGCALPPDKSVTICGFTTLTPSTRTYDGEYGYAPEWETGPLSQAGEENIRACLDSVPGAVPGTQVGMGLNAQQEENMRKLFQYLVQCALEPAQSVVLLHGDDTGQPNCALDPPPDTCYFGAMGLAPWWKDAELNPTPSPADCVANGWDCGDGTASVGERRISACIAARVNADGKTVQLSLRGMGMGVSPIETAQFTHIEGAFAANLFSTTPYIKSCAGLDETDIGGRLCTDPEGCSFQNFAGGADCVDACDAADDDVNGYSKCGNDNEVMNTYLPWDVVFRTGLFFACASYPDGATDCWGHNRSGELGRGYFDNPASEGQRFDPMRAPVLGLSGGVRSLSAGARNTCARLGQGNPSKESGSLWCWGINTSGQIGNGTAGSGTNVHTPFETLTNVADVPNAARAIAASVASCTVRTDGKVICWGEGSAGHMGDGTLDPRWTPGDPVLAGEQATLGIACTVDGDCDAGEQCNVDLRCEQELANVVKVSSVSSGSSAMCALDLAGDIYCWGALTYTYGVLGNGTDGGSNLPVRVLLPAGHQGIDVAAGEYHVCAVTHDGSVASVYCWGNNPSGQVGPSASPGANNEPVPVPGLPFPPVAIDAAGRHSCALLTDGSMWCWGEGSSGELCSGDTADSADPVEAMPGLIPDLRLRSISLGAASSCGQKLDGTVWCCGANRYGQLGDQNVSDQYEFIGTMFLAEKRLTPVRMVNHACGNNVCDHGETTATCSADCKTLSCNTCDVTDDCVTCGGTIELKLETYDDTDPIDNGCLGCGSKKVQGKWQCKGCWVKSCNDCTVESCNLCAPVEPLTAAWQYVATDHTTDGLALGNVHPAQVAPGDDQELVLLTEGTLWYENSPTPGVGKVAVLATNGDFRGEFFPAAGRDLMGFPLIVDLEGSELAEFLAAEFRSVAQGGAVYALRVNMGNTVSSVWTSTPWGYPGVWNMGPSAGDLVDTVAGVELVVPSWDGDIGVLNRAGTVLSTYNTFASDGEHIYGHAAIANVDGTAGNEIVVVGANSGRVIALDPPDCGMPPCPAMIRVYLSDPLPGGRTVFGSGPAVGDIDGDGKPEIIVVSTGGPPAIYAFSADAAIVADHGTGCRHQWNSPGGADYYWTSAAIGDVDNDGRAEVVVMSSDAVLSVLEAGTAEDGSCVEGTVQLTRTVGNDGRAWFTPVLADLVGDASLDVVTASFTSLQVIDVAANLIRYEFIDPSAAFYPSVLIEDTSSFSTDPRIYISGWKNNLVYRFDLSVASGAKQPGSSWTTYMGDNTRTGFR